MIKLNEIYESLIETDDKTITLYHRVGLFKSSGSVSDIIDSVVKNGLIPKDNGEIGPVIWFSKNFADYANNGSFVVSYTFNPEILGTLDNKYGIYYDGTNGYIHKRLPFNELNVIKIPVLHIDNLIQTNIDLIRFINRENKPFTPELFNNINKNLIIYVDIFNEYVQPYINQPNFISGLDKNKIKLINVIK